MTALLAGTLDAAAGVVSVLIFFHRDPRFFFQFVASGIWGKAAFAGGSWIIATGALLHYAIALFWVALFFFSYSALRIGMVSVRLAGLAFGLVVWLVMNLLVLPLSRAPGIPLHGASLVVSALTVILLVGLPTSAIARRCFGRGTNPAPA